MANRANGKKIAYVIQETPDYENNWQDDPALPAFGTYHEAQRALQSDLDQHPHHSYHFSHRIREKTTSQHAIP
jgi:hypothetical protein